MTDTTWRAVTSVFENVERFFFFFQSGRRTPDAGRTHRTQNNFLFTKVIQRGRGYHQGFPERTHRLLRTGDFHGVFSRHGDFKRRFQIAHVNYPRFHGDLKIKIAEKSPMFRSCSNLVGNYSKRCLGGPQKWKFSRLWKYKHGSDTVNSGTAKKTEKKWIADEWEIFISIKLEECLFNTS